MLAAAKDKVPFKRKHRYPSTKKYPWHQIGVGRQLLLQFQQDNFLTQL